MAAFSSLAMVSRWIDSFLETFFFIRGLPFVKMDLT